MKPSIVTLAIGIILLGGYVFGKSELTPEQRAARKAARQKVYDSYYGGTIDDVRHQRGTVSFVNSQSRVSVMEVENAISWLRETMKVRVETAEGKFNIANVEKKGDVTIFIVDDKVLPPTLIASEQLWGIVNVAWIHSEKESFTKARLAKQLVRVFAQVCGGVSSNYDNPLVGHIAKASELDNVTDYRLPVDLIKRCIRYLDKCGITQSKKSTYRQACQEGWAPQPTNDVQRAIWKEVHSVPDNPITIKFDPKKDK